MTWASHSLSHGLSRTRIFLRRQLWVWPIIAVVVLSIIGFTLRNAIESTIKGNLSSGLQTVLQLETHMLLNWFEQQKENAESAANNRSFRALYTELQNSVASSETSAVEDVRNRIEVLLGPDLTSGDYAGYFITDKDGAILASTHETLRGQRDVPEYRSFVSESLEGNAAVSPPFESLVMMKTESGRTRPAQPVMYVSAPIRDDSFSVIGVLALQILPTEEFTRILQIGRVGESGETYAFNRDGVLVSNSRFDEDLFLLGLLPDKPGAQSILNVLVRDPGGNVTEGYRPTTRRAQLPLTKMAESAIAGNADVDVEGYRDYRGVPVVGAWTWLSEYNIGVATEVDVAQAFRPIVILQRAFWVLYGLLIISSIAIFVFTVIVARLQREAQKEAIKSQKLGQYTLEEKLGDGAMGVVYKGHHSMLRRPTAVKLLNVDKVDDNSIARFEREVQITCQLNNPNTISIYDYGRTPEGVFYYAMEYLDGINLQELVERYGPQPESRVIHIMQQICGSLNEAHSLGLVHRDIKPANIMLNQRGGVSDIIKVLDFGLVRALNEEKASGMTSATALTGTPLYMSPESIESPLSVDGRSDLYAVGAVGYFLLTGEPVFTASSILELCQRQVDESPVPPGERRNEPVTPELENAILKCLEKSRASRPQTAAELSQLLKQCPAAQEWSDQDADAWWGRHKRGEIQQVTFVSEAINDSSGHDQTVIAEMPARADKNVRPK